MWAVVKLIRKHHIDLLHSNTLRAHIVGSLAARLTGRPLVWTLHDVTFPRLLLRALVSTPQAIICVSHYIKGFYGLPSARVIHNGIEPVPCRGGPLCPPFFSTGLRQELGISPDAPLVVNVGRLVPGKGQYVFVRAAAQVLQQVPEARFLMVGGPDPSERRQPGPRYSEELSALVEELGLSQRVLSVGHRQDVPRFWAAADVCAYTSVSPEGFPTVLLEAMAHDRAVVASNLGGAPEIVEDGITGLLVPPGDIAALAAGIIELLENRVKSREMGRAGRARVTEAFDLHLQANQMDRVYREVWKHSGWR